MSGLAELDLLIVWQMVPVIVHVLSGDNNGGVVASGQLPVEPSEGSDC